MKRVLGTFVAEVYSKNPNRAYTGKEIVADINLRYKIQITYHQAWRAKKFAMELLRGTHEELFAKLPVYCHNLKIHNPGTVTYIQTDESERFQFIYVALGVSVRKFICLFIKYVANIFSYIYNFSFFYIVQIRSFQNTCRRSIVVDGAHLKGEYKGVMLVAVDTDGNNQILPVAFGVCRSETNENWILFFQKLYETKGLQTPVP